MCEAGHKKYTKNVFYGNYADEAVKNFPELESVLKAVKYKLKREISKGKVVWRG